METINTFIDFEIQKQLEALHAVTHQPDPELDEFLKSALRIKLEGREPEAAVNTYLKPFEIPQIELFDILANRFPLVLDAQKIVASKFIKLVENKEVVYLLDLGIGRGLQTSRILEAFNDVQTLKKVVVMGIEIFKPALDHTTEHFKQLKNQLHYELEFHPINSPVEDLDFDEIESLLPQDGNYTLLVNASLTLHHVQESKKRRNIFKSIKNLNPVIFTLIEPDADGFTDEFDQRLMNVYRHFTALFRFTASLPLEPAEIHSLKTFFSNDFYDPIALPNESRFEKLQTSDEWIRLAKENGYQPVSLQDCLESNSVHQVVTHQNEGIIFSHENVNLLATMGFQ